MLELTKTLNLMLSIIIISAGTVNAYKGKYVWMVAFYLLGLMDLIFYLLLTWRII